MNLYSLAELCWRQVFPNPGSQTPITLEEFIETARSEYALQFWVLSKAERREEGIFNVPSNLLSEAELSVKDNYIDLDGLEILRSLSDDTWLQRIEDEKGCRYIRTTINRAQILDEDHSLDDDIKTYFIVGKKILFPRGISSDKVKVVYANNGSGVDEGQEIEEHIGGILRTRLIEIYAGKTGRSDETNNSNPNT